MTEYTPESNAAVGEVISEYTADTQETEPVEEAIEETTEEIESIEDLDDGVEAAPTHYNIDGEDIPIETIKEWKNGNLRQSDYTRKTQELAAERERLKEASTIYDYLRNNPAVVQAIRQVEQNPNITGILPSEERDQIAKMRIELETMKVDSQLRELHTKYGDFDEDAMFRTANEKGVKDLELVVQSMLYNNKPTVDAVAEAKRQLKEELENNKEATKTTVKSKAKQPSAKKDGLTAQEKRVAMMLGVSETDYQKWK